MQVKWIMNDFHVKQQQFNQRVNDAMISVVDKLETREAYHVVTNRLVTLNNDSIFSLLREKSIFTEPQELAAPDEPPVPPDIENITPPLPPEYADPLDDEMFDEIKMEIRHMGGRKVTIRHKNHIITIDDSLKKTEYTDDDMNRIEQERVLIDKQREKVDLKLKRLQDVMTNMAFEFVSDDRDISKRISYNQLDTLLGTELQNKGICLKYNFGVTESNTDSLLLSNNKNVADLILKSPYKVDLFPNDLFSKPVYLALHFPQSLQFVLSTMWLMLVSSGLFIAVMVMGFVYTIYMMLRQKKLSDIKNDFINNMTHEFKTPIATISLASDAVTNPKILENRESVARYINIIKEENQRMHKQVETILQMALLDKKNFKINKEEVEMHSLIEKTVEQMKLQVEAKNGTIVAELNAKNHVITGDRDLLLNTISNLIDNAIKYSPQNPQIKICTRDVDKYISVTVEDNGIGMSREVQKNIFEKFYRAAGGNIHDVKGFGLGLSFVKAIAIAHNGDIKVLKSEPGKGTIMELLLPVNMDELYSINNEYSEASGKK